MISRCGTVETSMDSFPSGQNEEEAKRPGHSFPPDRPKRDEVMNTLIDIL
jgi:hypothetical protein